MSAIDSVNGNEKFQEFRQQLSANGGNELGKTEFLELMVAQLNNQNPLNPEEHSEFVAQLAQFSSVEGITNLNESVTSIGSGIFSMQALQASSLVGRSVLVDNNQLKWNENDKPKRVFTDIPVDTNQLSIEIYHRESGDKVFHQELGPQTKGEISISWPGIDTNGDPVNPGEYRAEVFARALGQKIPLEVQTSANINSVAISESGQIDVNVDGLGKMPFERVREIAE